MASVNQDSSRIAAIEAAREVLDGKLSVIEGCRRLNALSCDLVDDWRVDKDFAVFGAVDSETDCLPVGAVRQHWNSSALVREDEKIEVAEALYRDRVMAACSNLVRRFESTGSNRENT